MIIESRRRNTKHQANRHRYPRPNSYASLLTRIIMNSQAFHRPMEWLYTRKAVKREGFFATGGVVQPLKSVQRLLGNPDCDTKAPDGQMEEDVAGVEELRFKSDSHTTEEIVSVAQCREKELTAADIRELRRKALVSSLQYSASRWGRR